MNNGNQNDSFTQNGVSKDGINSSIGENCRRCVYADVNGKPANNEFCNNCNHNEKNKSGGFNSTAANSEKVGFDNPYSQGFKNYQNQQASQTKQKSQYGSNPYSQNGNANQNNASQNGNPNGGQNGKSNGNASSMSIASLVLGIVSLVLCCNPVRVLGVVTIPVQFICSLLAIIFAAITIKKPPRGFAIAGLVTGIVSILLFVFVVVFIMLLGVAMLPF